MIDESRRKMREAKSEICAARFYSSPPAPGPSIMWFVYIVRCADDTLYTGIARDVERRVNEHNAAGRLGANYTRARRPVALVYTEAVESRSSAARREHEIKQMTRPRKDELLKASRMPGLTKNAVTGGEPEAAARVCILS